MTLPALVELMGFETAIAPKDINGVAQVGDWISLKHYSHVTIRIAQGAWAGGTPAVTLNQATDVTGTTNKPLSFTARWVKLGLTPGSTFGKLPVVNDTFTLPNTANNITILEINGDDLDVDNGFDCVSISIASPGAFSDFLGADYLLSGARFAQAVMPDAKID
jgi:hypothetical protein